MQRVRSAAPVLPTDLAGLPRLLAYTQAVGLERCLFRRTRGIPSLVLALVWLVLAWRGTGRPHHVAEVQEPLLAAVLGRERVPSATTLYRSLRRFPAQAVRGAVEAAYQAELPCRTVCGLVTSSPPPVQLHRDLDERSGWFKPSVDGDDVALRRELRVA